MKIDMKKRPVYQRLQMDANPIYIWGTGALARDVFKYCGYYNIEVAGFFVNSGEKQEQFERRPVYTLDEISYRDKVSVIIGHHHYKEGKAFLDTLPYVDNIYYLTEVSYGMWNEVSLDELRSEKSRWEILYNSLNDSLSKDCLRSFIESRIFDDAEKMFPYYAGTENYYTQDFLKLSDNEIFLDVGACVGNTIWTFIKAVSGKYQKVIALEPEQKNYKLLCASVIDKGYDNIVTKQLCAWKQSGVVKFQGDGELGGIADKNFENSYELPAVAIDDLREKFSLIKINFPFSVSDILEGATVLLQSEKPKLVVRVGFKEKLILETYKKIKEINPKYQFYFRYTLGMPEGLTLYAV